MATPGGTTFANIKVTAASVGLVSAQAVGANLQRGGITFKNESSTNSVAICPASFGAAALNTAGNITLAPGGSIVMDNLRTVDAFNAAATANGTPLTIWES